MKKTLNKTVSKLPMTYPFFTTRTLYAHLFSVLLNHKQSYPWIFNHFIQIYGTASQNFPVHFALNGFTETMYNWHLCPFIAFQVIHKDFIFKNYASILDFYIESIQSGYYIQAVTNQFFIPAFHQFYKKTRVLHAIFIFGYDTKEQTFDVADFFDYGKYTYTTVPFRALELASVDTQNLDLDWYLENDQYCYITLIRYRDKEYRFDMDLLCGYIEDYLSGQAQVDAYVYRKMFQDENWALGVKFYHYLQTVVEKKATHNEHIDHRSFYALWDHKTLMLHRIRFLEQHGFLAPSQDIYDGYCKIEKIAHTNLLIILKYNLTQKTRLLDRVLENLETLEKKEVELLQQMLVRMT